MKSDADRPEVATFFSRHELMTWQNTFNTILGPGLLAGIRAGDWFGLLAANRFRVSPRYVLRCLSATGASLGNSSQACIEQWMYGRQVARQDVAPPLFILGHWRSGTTHLHNLLARDDRFAFPNLYQVLYPHHFLLTEEINSRLLSTFLPRTRTGVDNVRIAWSVPYEEEFAIAVISQISPYVTMSFPQRGEFYDRFLTLQDASPEEIRQWKESLITFARKLTYRYQLPLIFKSPPHTCRISLLLELFPAARFVHIRRNPYDVFGSMQKMLAATLRLWPLHHDDGIDWEERTLRQYRQMYDVYFRQRSLIPEGRLHELSFEDLEADPVEQVRGIYSALDLPPFGPVESRLRAYIATLTGYQKNPPTPLSTRTCKRIAREWAPCFDAWGYSPSYEP
jgi:omega-hydroxy-beta-dihydromenaquinone-9 sulfotransferase